MRFLLSSFFTKNIASEKMTRNVHVLICLFLVFATLMVYRQILYYEFIDLDDYEYVAENQTVQNGLTIENIAWSFTTTLTGITLAREGRIDEAIKHYREALQKNPDFEEAHNNLAIALYYKGNTNEAIRHLQEAIRIGPDYANAKQNLQEMLKDQQHKPE